MKIKGTVQTIHCHREGDLRWIKEVWVPNDEQAAFYDAYAAKVRGPFFYDVKGDIRSLQRRPAAVPMWSNF